MQVKSIAAVRRGQVDPANPGRATTVLLLLHLLSFLLFLVFSTPIFFFASRLFSCLRRSLPSPNFKIGQLQPFYDFEKEDLNVSAPVLVGRDQVTHLSL